MEIEFSDFAEKWAVEMENEFAYSAESKRVCSDLPFQDWWNDLMKIAAAAFVVSSGRLQSQVLYYSGVTDKIAQYQLNSQKAIVFHTFSQFCSKVILADSVQRQEGEDKWEFHATGADIGFLDDKAFEIGNACLCLCMKAAKNAKTSKTLNSKLFGLFQSFIAFEKEVDELVIPPTIQSLNRGKMIFAKKDFNPFMKKVLFHVLANLHEAKFLKMGKGVLQEAYKYIEEAQPGLDEFLGAAEVQGVKEDNRLKMVAYRRWTEKIVHTLMKERMNAREVLKNEKEDKKLSKSGQNLRDEILGIVRRSERKVKRKRLDMK